VPGNLCRHHLSISLARALGVAVLQSCQDEQMSAGPLASVEGQVLLLQASTITAQSPSSQELRPLASVTTLSLH
jgi:hypothetical protein